MIGHTQRAAVLGAGNMGTGIVRALAGGKVPVSVWNRTPEKADKVAAQFGALAERDIGDAIRTADVVFIVVNDYPTTRTLLDRIDVSGKTLVGYAMSNPKESQAMAKWAADRDARFVEGMVMVLPDAVGTDACRGIYAAPPGDFARVEEMLHLFGQGPLRISDQHGAVAVLTGVVVANFWTSAATYVLMAESAKWWGVDYATSLTEILEGMSVFENAYREATSVMRGDLVDPGQVNIGRGAESTRVLLDGVAAAGLDGQILKAVHDLLSEATARGYGTAPLGQLSQFYRVERAS